MLARLEAIDGVATAEVDHGGELLRLRVADDRALADVTATLREMGYGADPLQGDVNVDRWYGRDTVQELSHEEGRGIAERVVRAFARSRGVDAIVAERLEGVLARTLGAYFAAHSIDPKTPRTPLIEDCIRAVREAATALIGPDAARELAAALREDLEGSA